MAISISSEPSEYFGYFLIEELSKLKYNDQFVESLFKGLDSAKINFTPSHILGIGLLCLFTKSACHDNKNILKSYVNNFLYFKVMRQSIQNNIGEYQIIKMHRIGAKENLRKILGIGRSSVNILDKVLSYDSTGETIVLERINKSQNSYLPEYLLCRRKWLKRK